MILIDIFFYSFKIDILKDIVSNISMDDYKYMPGDWISEEYFDSKVDKDKYKVKKVLVKEGIPFVPSIFLGVLVTMFAADWFLLILRI